MEKFGSVSPGEAGKAPKIYPRVGFPSVNRFVAVSNGHLVCLVGQYIRVVFFQLANLSRMARTVGVLGRVGGSG